MDLSMIPHQLIIELKGHTISLVAGRNAYSSPDSSGEVYTEIEVGIKGAQKLPAEATEVLAEHSDGPVSEATDEHYHVWAYVPIHKLVEFLAKL